jgi:hypothetical protein
LFLPQKVVTAGGIETAEATVNINNRVNQIEVHGYDAVRRGKGESLCKDYPNQRLHARLYRRNRVVVKPAGAIIL